MGFASSLKRGEEWEAELDTFFGKSFILEPIPQESFLFVQKLGIDRVLVNKKTGSRWSTEYKSDDRAADTNNFFIEVISVDTPSKEKKGWALTTCAQKIVFYIPRKNVAYIVSAEKIRDMLSVFEHDRERYPYRPCGETLNDGYRSWGYCVPVSEIAAMATKVYRDIKPRT